MSAPEQAGKGSVHSAKCEQRSCGLEGELRPDGHDVRFLFAAVTDWLNAQQVVERLLLLSACNDRTLGPPRSAAWDARSTEGLAGVLGSFCLWQAVWVRYERPDLAPHVRSDRIWLARHSSCRPHLRTRSCALWGCLLGIASIPFQVVVTTASPLSDIRSLGVRAGSC